MSLRELLSSLSDRPFLLVRPGGNQGDETNYKGLDKLMRELKINVQTMIWDNPRVRAPLIADNAVIYQHGGGGFIKLWKWQPQLMKLLRQIYPKNMLIVGPSTVALDMEYLDPLMPKNSDKIFFFARERTTYKFVKEHFYTNPFLDHCPAFNLTKEDYLKWHPNMFAEEYRLLIPRVDSERVPLPVELNMKDYDVIVDPNPCGDNFTRQNYLRLHARAKSIMTNHVHSAVLGAILEKDTTLFRNSYHKNRSIYEYSLEGRGVKWLGSPS